MSTNTNSCLNPKCRDDNDAAKKYKNNFVLSDAIGNNNHQLIYPIEITYQKMLKDKKDDPDKKIPPKFGSFIKSNDFKELLESMLDYCRVFLHMLTLCRNSSD